MFKNLLKKGKSKKGFTLIELIVVIAIIAILALILVPRFAGFTDTAAQRTNEGNRRTIETAVQVMIADGRLTGTGTFEVTGGPVAAPTTTVQNASESLNWPSEAAASPTPEINTALRLLVGTNVRPAGGITGYKVTVAASGITVENFS